MQTITIHNNRLDIFVGNWHLGMRHPVVLGVLGLAYVYCVANSVLKLPPDHAPALIIAALVVEAVFAVALLLFAVTLTSVGLALIASGERGILGQHDYRFTEAGLVESTSVNENLMKWGGIHSLLRTPHYFVTRG